MVDLEEYVSSPVLNGQFVPIKDELNEKALEELEEELVMLTRQYGDLLAAGKVHQARDLEYRIHDVEDMIFNLEFEYESE